MQTELPNAVDSEVAILGGMIFNKTAIAEAVELVRPEDFYRPANRIIFETITTIWSSGIDVDGVSVAGTLEDEGALASVGGHPYIAEIVANTPTSANITWHANRVSAVAELRRLANAATTIAQAAETTAPSKVSDALDIAQRALAGVPRDESGQGCSLGEATNSIMGEIWDAKEGISTGKEPNPTGLVDLDKMLNGGMSPGQMIIIAARPGVGKSTLAVDIIRETIFRQGKSAVMFSLEMTQNEIAYRILSAESQVALSKMKNNDLNDYDMNRLAVAAEAMDLGPLTIFDDSTMTMMGIQAKARRLAQSKNLGVIVIDYLQLLNGGTKGESRQQVVSGFSRALKNLAKELEVPIIAVAQLNRGVEQRGEDAKPKLSDLRESGSLEQDADIVLMIDRAAAKDPNSPKAGDAEINVAKNRGGRTGEVKVVDRMKVCQFSNYSAI